MMSEYHEEITPLGHLIQSRICPLAFNYTYKSLFYDVREPLDEGRQMKKQRITMRNSKRFSKKELEPANISQRTAQKWRKPISSIRIDIYKNYRSTKFRISKISSTFTAEALAIDETEVIENIDLEQNFIIFSYSASVLTGIGNSSTMNNTSHITQMLKDKIEKLESQGKDPFYWIPEHCGIQINERADSEAKQAIKESRDRQLLLPVADIKTRWKKKGKEELHSFCQNTKRDRGERFFERYYKNGLALWFREIKMNRRAFVSINRMRSGHTSLKASLNIFHTVSTTECECGDGLQTEDIQ
jgi:hypothetical protein